ncbi:MAG: hypothetical protein IJE89_01385 [Bacilli bacterium]|nr:hypothetical protein [Bacilli bacterium]
MSINPDFKNMREDIVIENINDFLDYKKKSDAEFAAAIGNIEFAIDECVKRFDFIQAFKLLKLKAKFENLAIKKGIEKDKEEFRSLRGKH